MQGSKRSHNARAVVTGAGSGLGRAFALELARRGSLVVAADINLESANETVSMIESLGGKALATHTDVASEDSVRALGRTATDWFGLPTLVINNAGIGVGGTVIGDGNLKAWRKAVDVNMWSVVYGIDVFTPMLRKSGYGGIINTASAAGFAAAPGMAPYSLSKAGVISVSETLAAELRGTEIAVTVLCPTFIATNIFDGELIDPQAAQEAKRLAEKNNLSADDIAAMTLNANDRGTLYLLPQRDARVFWRVKRLFPVFYSKLSARLVKLPQTAIASNASDSAK